VSEPVLVVRARRLRAARGVVVASDVALTAGPGEVVAVEGPNGSGKSMLLAAAAGVLPADDATDAGPPLQAAAVTAITLIPVLTWLAVLAHRACGRELARAFAAHAGGRGRAHLATDLGLVPFAVLLALAALVAPLISQGSRPHPLAIDLKIVGLHLAAAAFGAGLGSLLALIERAGWRLLAAVALFLVLFVARATPMAPLLRLSTHPATPQTPIGGAAAWLVLPGLALVAAAAFLATRLT